MSVPSATLSTTGRRRSQLRLTRKLKITLEQRTALRYAMPPMTSQETSSYISHHLKLAGFSELCRPSCKVGMSHQVTAAARGLQARCG